MASMKFCFNGTLYRKNLKRFWPLMLVFFLVWMLSLFLPLASQELQSLEDGSRQQRCAYVLFSMTNTLVPILVAITGTVTAWAVFSYLFSSKSVSAYHALPLRREGLFLSSALSGLSILFLPCLALLPILAGYEAFCGAWEPISFGNLAVVLFGGQLILFSVAALMAMLAGNAPGMLALTVVANFLAPFLEATVKYLGEQFLYGVLLDDLSAVSRWLSPIYHMFLINGDYYSGAYVADDLPEKASLIRGLPDLWIYGVYALAAVALLAFALFLYKKRPLENSGSLLAFPALRPVFTVGAGLCLSLLMTLLIQSIWNEEMSLPATLLLMAFWAFIGWFAALMLVRKSFRVFTKGTIAGWAGLTAAICLAMVLFCSVDILGLETWVPDADELESSYVTVTGLSTRDENDTETTLALHRLVLEHLDELQARDTLTDGQYDGAYVGIYFHYTLKNGKIVNRKYYYQTDTRLFEQADTLEAVIWDYCSDGDRVWRNEFGSAEIENIAYCSVAYYADILGEEIAEEDMEILGYQEGSVTLTAEEAQALASAIREDFDAGRSHYTSDLTGVADYTPYTLYFSVVLPAEDGGEADSQSYNVDVTSNMTSTLAAIEELGIEDRLSLSETYYDSDYENYD